MDVLFSSYSKEKNDVSCASAFPESTNLHSDPVIVCSRFTNFLASARTASTLLRLLFSYCCSALEMYRASAFVSSSASTFADSIASVTPAPHVGAFFGSPIMTTIIFLKEVRT